MSRERENGACAERKVVDRVENLTIEKGDRLAAALMRKTRAVAFALCVGFVRRRAFSFRAIFFIRALGFRILSGCDFFGDRGFSPSFSHRYFGCSRETFFVRAFELCVLGDRGFSPLIFASRYFGCSRETFFVDAFFVFRVALVRRRAFFPRGFFYSRFGLRILSGSRFFAVVFASLFWLFAANFFRSRFFCFLRRACSMASVFSARLFCSCFWAVNFARFLYFAESKVEKPSEKISKKFFSGAKRALGVRGDFDS